MQREILFKGKRVDGKGWVYGDLFNVTKIVVITKSNEGIYTKIGSDSFKYEYIEVHPESVCQFTGLTDKNGVKIFEGDKLKTDAFDYIYIVKFIDNAFNLYHEDLKEWDGTQLKWGGLWRLNELNLKNEVIGSVHD